MSEFTRCCAFNHIFLVNVLSSNGHVYICTYNRFYLAHITKDAKRKWNRQILFVWAKRSGQEMCTHSLSLCFSSPVSFIRLDFDALCWFSLVLFTRFNLVVVVYSLGWVLVCTWSTILHSRALLNVAFISTFYIHSPVTVSFFFCCSCPLWPSLLRTHSHLHHIVYI